MAEGKFIAIEGIDGSGITTQAQRLLHTLTSDGFKALLTKEPTEGPVGSVIGHALQNRLNGFESEEVMALLFAADRLDHLSATVEPTLADSINVISQRYYLSSLAYQSESLDLDWLWTLNQQARKPDLTIYLSVPPRIADARIPSRWERQRYEDTKNLGRVSARFEGAIAFLRDRGVEVVEIDGTLPIDDVHTHVRRATLEALGAENPQGSLFEASV